MRSEKSGGEAAGGVLTRLVRDKRAATLPMMAVALIPFAGMVGGALDMSRLYLVKTRLQQACDAGALAARRTMLDDTLTAEAETQGLAMFNANLRTNDYGAENVTFELDPVLEDADETGRVAGTATARVQPSLMRLFGFDTITMTAACQAELNLTNTDVMFVLDLTGSMACAPADDNDTTCITWGNNNRTTDPVTGRPFTRLKAGSRLQGLRDAVTSFHTTMDAAVPDGIRLRFGFVPYTSSVNVGGILPAGALSTGTRAYQSRVANMTLSVWRPTTGSFGSWDTQNSARAINWDNCQKYGNNQSYDQGGGNKYTPDPTGNPAPAIPTGDVTASSKPDSVDSWHYERVTTSYSGDRTCQRRRRSRRTTYAQVPNTFALRNWTYRPVDYSLANSTMSLVETVPASARVRVSGSYNPRQLAAMQSLGVASGMTVVNRSTDGCIEERLTGMDDIESAATNDNTRWVPTWRWLTYFRSSQADETTASDRDDLRPTLGLPYNCTKSAQRLAVMDADDVSNFLNDPSFVAMGYTYHDVGMLWGARLMAQNGVFSADHVPADNGRPTARHIIFMTDGDMMPNSIIYSPFGLEYLARRRLPPPGTLNDATLKAAHNAAFLAACAAARGDNITIWVVAFGQALTPELEACADDETRTFESTDTATLGTQFQQIAARIAELRISQ